MSTVPEDARQDAGVEGTEETTSLVEDAETAEQEPPAPEEYRPRHARPDLDDEAAEADVVEQSQEVPGLDDPDAAAGA
ncbi:MULTISPECIES: hypothetical protein [unclassified Isoptericola]|uniref:hypothetical protein n=1 Tax=unclassified Isoptericola TaxID=2623355 RepID=UPI00365819C7